MITRRFLWLSLLALASACSGSQQETFTPVPVGDSPVRGPADAWVTIIEFADFQCPYCGQGAATMKEIERAYPEDARFVFKNLPLEIHEHAMDAALAAECARVQGKFWEMHDTLFEHQKALSPADLERYASGLSLDLDAWRACLTSPDAKARIEADVDLAGRLELRGTPAYFVNGYLIEGALPYEDFKKIVDRELEKAKASGIPRERYYEEAVMGGAK